MGHIIYIGQSGCYQTAFHTGMVAKNRKKVQHGLLDFWGTRLVPSNVLQNTGLKSDILLI
jgi:hypothetical protein